MQSVKQIWLGWHAFLRLAVVSAVAVSWIGSASIDSYAQEIQGPIVSQPVEPFVFEGDLSTLPKVEADVFEGVDFAPRNADDALPVPLSTLSTLAPPEIDPLLQDEAEPEVRAHGLLSSTILNFDASATGGNPQDTNGDVGPNHYVQMMNSVFRIYDKAGTSLAGPSLINTLWTAQAVVDLPCSTGNAGDPIVLYDPLADRWLLSQFNGASNLCVAISQTPNPTGNYFLYNFTLNQFPDYYKMGVWPDGYYLSANVGAGNSLVVVFDRASMLTGNPAAFV